MFQFIIRIILNNFRLKAIALILALVVWFYIVGELNRGSEEELKLLQQILPTQETAAKKLTIRPIFIGKPRWGYEVAKDKVAVIPEYCIVVGAKKLLDRTRFTYTMPIDVNGLHKSFTKSVPLSPIAPGIYMEETLVQVTVPIEKANE